MQTVPPHRGRLGIGVLQVLRPCLSPAGQRDGASAPQRGGCPRRGPFRIGSPFRRCLLVQFSKGTLPLSSRPSRFGGTAYLDLLAGRPVVQQTTNSAEQP